MNQIISYLNYLIKSKNLHGIHSPFAFHLVKDVIYKEEKPLDSDEIESLRSELIKDKTIITGDYFGAGSLSGRTSKTIGNFTNSSSKPVKYSRLLYRLAKWHQPQYALELGTAMGISAAYQSSGFSMEAIFKTIEGNSFISAKARQNLESLNKTSLSVIEGNFDDVLKDVLDNCPQIDWVFFDGNHKKEPTLRYFNQCLAKASERALFIFDDINWSSEMQEAWTELKNHPKVTLTIDLFFLGLVFIEKRPQKENFVVRF